MIGWHVYLNIGCICPMYILPIRLCLLTSLSNLGGNESVCWFYALLWRWSYFVSMRFFVFLQPKIEQVKVKERIQSIIRWKQQPTWAMTSRMKKGRRKKGYKIYRRETALNSVTSGLQLHNHVVPFRHARIRLHMTPMINIGINKPFILFCFDTIFELALWRLLFDPTWNLATRNYRVNALVSRDIGKKCYVMVVLLDCWVIPKILSFYSQSWISFWFRIMQFLLMASIHLHVIVILPLIPSSCCINVLL